MRQILPVLAAIILCNCLCAESACHAEALAAQQIVSPAHPDSLASSVTFRSIQTGTEGENPALFRTTDGSQPLLRLGIDSWIGSRVSRYDIPLAVAITPHLQAQLDIPFAWVTTDNFPGGAATETGLGDILLSVAYRAEVDNLFESHYILTTKFPSGDTALALGTGSYNWFVTDIKA